MELGSGGQAGVSETHNNQQAPWVTRDPRRRKRSLNSEDGKTPSVSETATPTPKKRHGNSPLLRTQNRFEALSDSDTDTESDKENAANNPAPKPSKRKQATNGQVQNTPKKPKLPPLVINIKNKTPDEKKQNIKRH